MVNSSARTTSLGESAVGKELKYTLITEGRLIILFQISKVDPVLSVNPNDSIPLVLFSTAAVT